jgi:hypothetical protein
MLGNIGQPHQLQAPVTHICVCFKRIGLDKSWSHQARWDRDAIRSSQNGPLVMLMDLGTRDSGDGGGGAEADANEAAPSVFSSAVRLCNARSPCPATADNLRRALPDQGTINLAVSAKLNSFS